MHFQVYIGDVLAEGVVKQSPLEQSLVDDLYHCVQHSSQRNPKTTLLDATAVTFQLLAGCVALCCWTGGQRMLLMLHGFRSSVLLPRKQAGLQRTEKMELMYGKTSPMILGM